MADSEHDEMFEDAEDSGDDQPRAKTRKTASGRVLIHSKEGDSFKKLNSTYAVLLGGEVVDRTMLLAGCTVAAEYSISVRDDP